MAAFYAMQGVFLIYVIFMNTNIASRNYLQLKKNLLCIIYKLSYAAVWLMDLANWRENYIVFIRHVTYLNSSILFIHLCFHCLLTQIYILFCFLIDLYSALFFLRMIHFAWHCVRLFVSTKWTDRGRAADQKFWSDMDPDLFWKFKYKFEGYSKAHININF